MHNLSKCTFLAIIPLCTLLIIIQPEPQLSIKNGKIRGTANRTVGENKAYFAFKGIPYARPPLGTLRFKGPLKADHWQGVLDATKDKDICVQGLYAVIGSEDCLYINVYTPSLTRKNIPVLLWIYGGGFLNGGSTYNGTGPDYFLDEDVIFVSFNYRLGVFGFLSTEDLTCPGNWGLKDQVLALHWVKENIVYFGGDPTKVTIFGQSAGAGSVSYLLETSKTKGLFRAAIMNSGSSLSLWSLSRHPRRIAFKIGQALQISQNSSAKLIQGLRKINYVTLQNISTIIGFEDFGLSPLAGIFFAPVKEPYHKNAVFYKKSYQLFSNGNFHKVPILTGVTSNEGILFAQFFNSTAKKPSQLVHADMSRFVCMCVNNSLLAPADLTSNYNHIKQAGDLIKSYYLGNSTDCYDLTDIIRFLSDDQLVRPARELTLQLAKHVNVYFYVFSYKGKLGTTSNRTFKGVSHAEDLYYLFRTYPNFTVPKRDILTRKRMVKLWTNFVKFSNPTPCKDNLLQDRRWPTAGSNRSNLVYFDIGQNLKVQANPFKLRMKFNDYIYKKFGNPGYHDTY